jgi:hypothetical protein
MTRAEQVVLTDIVQVLENLTAGLAAIEEEIGRRNSQGNDPRQAAKADLAALRAKIAYLPVDQRPTST